MDAHAGAVIFGGPMSANDPDDYVKTETDWISVPLAEGRPFLGICLGAQMLARNLGADVAEHPDELVEIGYYGLQPTQAGRAIMDWPEMVYQWHREGCDLPSGAVRLARSNSFENQAFFIRAGSLRNSVSFRIDPRHDVQMDSARGASILLERRAAAAAPYAGTHAARCSGADLVE